jgi:hypothetical protein
MCKGGMMDLICMEKKDWLIVRAAVNILRD